MFRKWRQRRLEKLENELINTMALRIATWAVAFMQDEEEARKYGAEIVEGLLKDEKKLRVRIARIESRL